MYKEGAGGRDQDLERQTSELSPVPGKEVS